MAEMTARCEERNQTSQLVTYSELIASNRAEVTVCSWTRRGLEHSYIWS